MGLSRAERHRSGEWCRSGFYILSIERPRCACLESGCGIVFRLVKKVRLGVKHVVLHLGVVICGDTIGGLWTWGSGGSYSAIVEFWGLMKLEKEV